MAESERLYRRQRLSGGNLRGRARRGRSTVWPARVDRAAAVGRPDGFAARPSSVKRPTLISAFSVREVGATSEEHLGDLLCGGVE